MWICFTNLKWWKVNPSRWCHYSGLFYNKCHNEYAIHWVVKGVVTTFGISEFNISYFKHSQLSLSQSDVVSAIDNGINVTTGQNENYINCTFYQQKCVSVLSTLETESSAVHIAHRGKKLYSSYFFFDPWFDSGSAAKTTWLGTRRRRTQTSTTPQRGWRGPGWSRHPFPVSLFCSHSVTFVLISSFPHKF